MIIACSKCNKRNRLPDAGRPGRSYICGNCKSNLATDEKLEPRFRLTFNKSQSISIVFAILFTAIISVWVTIEVTKNTSSSVKQPSEASSKQSESFAPQSPVPKSSPTIIPEPSPSPISLQNGARLCVFTKESGHCTIEIDNGTRNDAIVNLIRRKKLYYSVYVRAGEKASIKKLLSGKYEVVFRSGIDWNKDIRKFNRDNSVMRFDDALYFTEEETQRETDDGVLTRIRYSNYTISLHKVPNGKAILIPASDDEFDVPEASSSKEHDDTPKETSITN